MICICVCLERQREKSYLTLTEFIICGYGNYFSPHPLIMGTYKHTEIKGLAKGYMASK